jgi:hypothetical protein
MKMLNPWRYKPTVHRRIYKSLPPVPILIQLDRVYIPSQSTWDPFWSHLPIYTSVFSVVSFLRAFPPKPCWLLRFPRNFTTILRYFNNKTVPLPPCRRQRGEEFTSWSFLTSALDGGKWSGSRLKRALTPGKDPRFQVDMRLGGPQSLSRYRGQGRNPLLLPENF